VVTVAPQQFEDLGAPLVVGDVVRYEVAAPHARGYRVRIA
jgi:hypothetical protein